MGTINARDLVDLNVSTKAIEREGIRFRSLDSLRLADLKLHLCYGYAVTVKSDEGRPGVLLYIPDVTGALSAA